MAGELERARPVTSIDARRIPERRPLSYYGDHVLKIDHGHLARVLRVIAERD